LVGGQAPSEAIETINNIRRRHAPAYILAIGATTEPHEVRQALEAGADGFLGQSTTSETLIMAIELAVRDEAVLPVAFVKTMQKNSALRMLGICNPDMSQPASQWRSDAGSNHSEHIVSTPAFSLKEEMILQLLAEGAANKLIAQRLSITEATVKVHVKSILRKIRAKNRTQAAIWALEHYSLRTLFTKRLHNADQPPKIPVAQEVQ